MHNTITFDDVIGHQNEKEELREINDFLISPDKYTIMGARVPKGVILHGRPGTGKTLLAKAMAGEAKVPFYSIQTGNKLDDSIKKSIKETFAMARLNAPSIIFIDEIDRITSSQRNFNNEEILNTLLNEMDGFEANKGLVVLAATNKIHTIDNALLRVGRFDRRISISMPDYKTRIEIINFFVKNKKLSTEIISENIANRTSGFSGADIETLINEAAILAVRNKQNEITSSNIEEAIDRIKIDSVVEKKEISKDDKKRVAYHESGHAVASLFSKGFNSVQKISIISRGLASGRTTFSDDEKSYYTNIRMKTEIIAMLGGMVAEKEIYKNISTSSESDVQKAYLLVKSMVNDYGMCGLNLLSCGIMRESEKKQRKIEKAIDYTLKEGLKNCKKIIHKNIKLLFKIADVLVEKETLYKKNIDEILLLLNY